MIRRFHEPMYNNVWYFDTVNHRFWSSDGSIELHPDSDYDSNLDAVTTMPEYYIEMTPLSDYIVDYIRIDSPQTVHTFDFVTHGNSVHYKDDSQTLGQWSTFESGVKNMEELVRTKDYTRSIKTIEAINVLVMYHRVDDPSRWYKFDMMENTSTTSDIDGHSERDCFWSMKVGLEWMDKLTKEGKYTKEFVEKKSQTIDTKEVMTQKSTIRRFQNGLDQSVWYFDTIIHRFWTTGATGDVLTFPDSHYDVNLTTMKRYEKYKELSPITKFVVRYTNKELGHTYTFDFVTRKMLVISDLNVTLSAYWTSFENGVSIMENEVQLGTYVRSIEREVSQVSDTKGLVVKYVLDSDPRFWYEFDYDTRTCVWHNPYQGDKPAGWSSFEVGIEYMDRLVTHGYSKQTCQKMMNYFPENEDLVVRYVLKENPKCWYTFDFGSKTAILHGINGVESLVYVNNFENGAKNMEYYTPDMYTKEIIHSKPTTVVDINVPAPVRWAQYCGSSDINVYDTVAKELYYYPNGKRYTNFFDNEYVNMFRKDGTMPTGWKEIPVPNARKFVTLSHEYLYCVDVDQKKVYEYQGGAWKQVWQIRPFEDNMKYIHNRMAWGTLEEILSSQVPVTKRFRRFNWLCGGTLNWDVVVDTVEKKVWHLYRSGKIVESPEIPKTFDVYLSDLEKDVKNHMWYEEVDIDQNWTPGGTPKKTVKVYSPTSKSDATWAYIVDHTKQTVHRVHFSNGVSENVDWPFDNLVNHHLKHLVSIGAFVEEQTKNRYFIPNKAIYSEVKWDFVWVLDYNDHSGYELFPDGTKKCTENDFVKAFGECVSRSAKGGDWVELSETETMEYLKNVGGNGVVNAPVTFKMSMWSTPTTFFPWYKKFYEKDDPSAPLVRYFRSGNEYDWGYVSVMDFTNKTAWSIAYDGLKDSEKHTLDYTQDEVDRFVKNGVWIEMTKDQACEYIKTKKMAEVIESTGHTDGEKVRKIREIVAEKLEI